MKKALVLGFLSGVLALSVFSQALAPGASLPKADGNLGANEYPLTTSYGEMRLGYGLSSDGKYLFLALEAPTTGWVALGLGSLKMDGAYMVLGYDDKGKAAITEETGKWHGHRTNADKKLVAGAVKEGSGMTVLEIELLAADYVKGKSLRLLMVYGRQDSFNSMHSAFNAVELPL